jgi:uncharacterized protein YbjT (DUF2867 family)
VGSRTDHATFGYYASRLAAERIVANSGLPWTTLRATQLHDLLLTTTRQRASCPCWKHRLTIPMRTPGGAARAFREGANLAPDRAVGRRTWEELLTQRVPSARENESP